ncbi:MAG: hypothetical protein C0506_02415 [Anaerolinea sp.]|nr:hypothetical protein [Anaerolinea sp.]
MKTTLDLSDETRARLKSATAKRRLAGYSPLIGEALERYVRAREERASKTVELLALAGALRDEADDMAPRVAEIRTRQWRDS